MIVAGCGYGQRGVVAIILVVVLVLVLDTASNYHFTNFPFLEDEHEDEYEDEYEKDQIKAHVYALPAEPKSHPSVTTAGALNLLPSTFYPIPCSLYETSVSFLIRLDARGQGRCSYETPIVNVSIWTKLSVSMSGLF